MEKLIQHLAKEIFKIKSLKFILQLTMEYSQLQQLIKLGHLISIFLIASVSMLIFHLWISFSVQVSITRESIVFPGL
jgi:hypothetical protein